MPERLKRSLFMVAGMLATGLGILGIFIPVLPTTPFLLLAAACFWRCSRRLHRWLLSHRMLGIYIASYLEGKGMPQRVKAATILLLWTSIGVSACIFIDSWVIRAVLLAVAVGVTFHIVRIKRKE